MSEISLDSFHSFILCEDGSLFGFGANSCGQLGLGHTNHQLTPQQLILPEEKKPIQISLGFSHSFILCEDSSLFCFGNNCYGQLGLGHTNQQLTPQCLILPKEDIKLNHQEDDKQSALVIKK
jgi:alpha-tubulin suppressor-like RCC1 family protein